MASSRSLSSLSPDTISWPPASWRAEAVREPEVWMARAGCASADPDLFFPNGATGEALRQARQAKAVCAHCPVARQCLAYALVTNQQYGVWGGLDEEERREVRRSWRRLRPGAIPQH